MADRFIDFLPEKRVPLSLNISFNAQNTCLEEKNLIDKFATFIDHIISERFQKSLFYHWLSKV